MALPGASGTAGYMAPELLCDGSENSRNSPAVDVFSFGILCVELWNGGPPYSDEQFAHGHQLIEFVRNGDRPSIGNNCPDDLADLIRHCWRDNPLGRPLFSEIVEKLIPITERMKNSVTSDVEHAKLKLRHGTEKEEQSETGSKKSDVHMSSGNQKSDPSGSPPPPPPDEKTPLLQNERHTV